MISVKDMHTKEKKAMEIGIHESIMMENAGANVARIINGRKPLKGKKVFLFCGTGNNAGDGLVFARHALVHGAKVDVYLIKKPEVMRSETTRRNYGILSSIKSVGHPVKFHVEKIPGKVKADILVDALLGTGLKDMVNEQYARVIKKFNESEGFKVSIDCPSGVNCDNGKVMGSAVKPDLTITFYDRKKGLNKRNSGEVMVADIGVPKI